MDYIIEMGIRNAFRSKLRLIFISILVALGLTVFSTTVGVANSAFSEIASLEKHLQAKTTITVVGKNNESIPLDEQARIKEIGGIKSISRDHYITLSTAEKNEVDAVDYFHIIEFDFENQLLDGAEDYQGKKNTGIVLPDFFSEAYQDNIMLSFDYRENGKVIADTQQYSIMGFYKRSENESAASGEYSEGEVCKAYMSKDVYGDLLFLTQTPPEAYSLILYLNDTASSFAIVEAISSMGYGAYTSNGLAEDYLGFIGVVQAAGTFFGLVLIGLSLVVVLQALSSSLKRREKTIGVMKAFGYRSREPLLMVVAEIMIYGTIALVLSLVFSILISQKISQSFSALSIGTTYTYSLEQFLVSCLVLVLFICISIIVPWYKCQKLSPIKVLKGTS
ncbi:MAG: ABC transporter permease [Coriobacteriales bacterium]|jgi:ABC-type antimicrobial peptide transport system permease subunit|nr:ABC transporter permease [Coriobacteriales bacterium]